MVQSRLTFDDLERREVLDRTTDATAALQAAFDLDDLPAPR
jgi:hypothetical protein